MEGTDHTRTRRARASHADVGGAGPRESTAKGKNRSRSGASGAEAEGPNSARVRILDAAEAIFAERGVDGARVDEIARVAGVNKALIYYYFEGKAQLLEAVMERVLAENVSLKQRTADATTSDEELFPALMTAGFDFLKRRKTFFRILLTELFQNDSESVSLFPFLERAFESAKELRERLGIGDVDSSVWRLPGVFFGMAPMLFFLLLEDKWVAYYQVSREELEREFLEQFTEFYLTTALRLQPKPSTTAQ